MMKMKNVVNDLLFLGIVMIFMSSCNLTKKYENQEKEEIQNYLGQHPELSFVLKESGLYYLDVTVGNR